MKQLLTRNLLSRLGAAGVLTCVLIAPQALAENGKLSPAALYEAGRQAFFRNDFKTAKPYFEKVLKVKPTHVPSRSMLNTILQAEKKAGAKDSMQGWAKRAIIPAIDVEEATLEEVIAFVRVKSRTVTKGAWEPNFILRKPEGGELPPITMALRKVPVEYVVQKMAELSGLAVRYEEHAIMIAPKDLLPPEPDALKEAEKSAANRREK